MKIKEVRLDNIANVIILLVVQLTMYASIIMYGLFYINTKASASSDTNDTKKIDPTTINKNIKGVDTATCPSSVADDKNIRVVIHTIVNKHISGKSLVIKDINKEINVKGSDIPYNIGIEEFKRVLIEELKSNHEVNPNSLSIKIKNSSSSYGNERSISQSEVTFNDYGWDNVSMNIRYDFPFEYDIQVKAQLASDLSAWGKSASDGKVLYVGLGTQLTSSSVDPGEQQYPSSLRDKISSNGGTIILIDADFNDKNLDKYQIFGSQFAGPSQVKNDWRELDSQAGGKIRKFERTLRSGKKLIVKTYATAVPQNDFNENASEIGGVKYSDIGASSLTDQDVTVRKFTGQVFYTRSR
ncbi:MAG: hypothetical protein HQK51_01890 [Oligoflexia bacterium]|nr:hypothetical protein [Oligoflexia bacterium]